MSGTKKGVATQFTIEQPYEIEKMMNDKKDLINIVECYSDWAGPTKAMETHYARYVTEYLKVRVIKVSTALVPWLRRFHMRSRPAFVICYKGAIKDVIVGLNIPKFDRVMSALSKLEIEEIADFDPSVAFQELNNDQQYLKCYPVAQQAYKETYEANKRAKEDSREIVKTPDEAFNDVVKEFENKWQILKQFTDVRIQECVGTLSVDVQADEGFNNMHTGHYANYSLYAEEKTMNFKRQIGQITQKEKLFFTKKVGQRYYDQQWVLVCFDYSDTELFEEMNKFYTQVMMKYSQLYYIFCIRGIDETNMDKLKQFYFYDNINIVADKNKFVQRIFNTPIVQDNYEEVFDDHFMSACFIFDFQGKLLEQHANAMFCRSFCFSKLQPTSTGNIPEICYDAAKQRLGYKGCYINILQNKINAEQTSSCIVYLHPYSEHLEEMVSYIHDLQTKYPNCRFILNFEEVTNNQQINALTTRCEEIQHLTIVSDLPSQYKFKANPSVISKYDFEPQKNVLVSPQSCFDEGEELTNDLATLIEKVGQHTQRQREYYQQNPDIEPEPINEQFIMTNILYCQDSNASRQVFTLNELNKYLSGSSQKENHFQTEIQKVADPDCRPEPQLLVESDMSLTYMGYKLRNVNKPNPPKQKQQIILAFVNDYHQNFPVVMFDLYKMQIQFPEICILLILQNCCSQDQLLELKNKFFFIDSFNVQESRPGLNEYFQTQKPFDASLLFLFNEKMEKVSLVQYPFQMIKLLSSNDKKSRPIVNDVDYSYPTEYHALVKELQEMDQKGSKDSTFAAKQQLVDDYPCNNLTFRGVPFTIIQVQNQFTRQDRIVLAVFNEEDSNFEKNVEYFSSLSVKHPTVFLLALIRGISMNNLEEMISQYPALRKINIASDQYNISLFTLLHDGVIQPRSFEVYQKNLFDCSCTDDSDLQEIVLDYTGTKWETGLKFFEKNMPFVINSNLRNFKKQGYVLSFFDFTGEGNKDDETVMSQTIAGLELYYQKVIVAYPEMYFALCVSHITKENMYAYREFFERNMYHYNEINLVANIDNACDAFCSTETTILNEAGEQELFEKSACYIFDKQDSFVEKHANAYDARQYCSKEFSSNFIRQVPDMDKDIVFDSKLKVFNCKGRTGQFLQKISSSKPKSYYTIIQLDKDNKSPDELQAIIDLQEKFQCYIMILFQDMSEQSWKDYLKMVASEANKSDASLAKDYYKLIQKVNVLMDNKITYLKDVDTKGLISVDSKNRLVNFPGFKKEDGQQSSITGILFYKSNNINTVYLNSLEELENELLLTQQRASSWLPESEQEIDFQELKPCYKLENVNAEALFFNSLNLNLQYIQKIEEFQYPDYCLTPIPANISFKQFRAQHPPERWFCYVYLNARHERFAEEAYQLQKLMNFTPSLYFIIHIRDVLTSEDISSVQGRFSSISNCNVIEYKHGYHQLMRDHFHFQGPAYYAIYNEFGPREFICNYAFELHHYIIEKTGENGYPFGDVSKQDESKDIQFIDNVYIVEGVIFKYAQQPVPYENQQNAIICYVNQTDDIASYLEQLLEVVEENKDFYTSVVIQGADTKKIKEFSGKFPVLAKFNVVLDDKFAFGYLFDPTTDYVNDICCRIYSSGNFDSECPNVESVAELLRTLTLDLAPQPTAEAVDKHRQSISSEQIGGVTKKKKRRTTNKESSENADATANMADKK